MTNEEFIEQQNIFSKVMNDMMGSLYGLTDAYMDLSDVLWTEPIIYDRYDGHVITPWCGSVRPKREIGNRYICELKRTKVKYVPYMRQRYNKRKKVMVG